MLLPNVPPAKCTGCGALQGKGAYSSREWEKADLLCRACEDNAEKKLGGERASVSYATAFLPKLFAASFCPCFAFRALTGTMTNVRKCLRDKHKKSTARTALTKNAAKNFGKKAVA